MKKYLNKIYVENKQYFIFVKLEYKNCININNDYCTNHSSGNPEITEHSNHIGGVMVSVLASSVVDRGFESWSGQTKNYKIIICCFSAKYV